MGKDIKILMVSSDRNAFKGDSAVSERLKSYGSLVKELHVVILAKGSLGFENNKIYENVWIYPTNSSSRFSYVRDASRLGKRIVFDKKFVRGQALITAQDPFECGLAAYKIKKKWRLPLEIQLHTDPFSPYFKGFLNTLRKIIARKVLKNADSVRVVRESLREKISRFTKASIKVLPIYVDKEAIERSQISFDLHSKFGWSFVLLVVARLSQEKNLNFALNILSRVHKSFPRVGLVVVGSGPEESKLKKMARKLGVEANVAFVGWQENLGSYYKTSNVFLQTSAYEGYGLALVEAGLSGLPVITTPVGIATELEHGKDALVYPAGNPDLFAEGILELIDSNEKRETLKINMKRFLELKLLSKEKYLESMSLAWEEGASKIKS